MEDSSGIDILLPYIAKDELKKARLYLMLALTLVGLGVAAGIIGYLVKSYNIYFVVLPCVLAAYHSVFAGNRSFTRSRLAYTFQLELLSLRPDIESLEFNLSYKHEKLLQQNLHSNELARDAGQEILSKDIHELERRLKRLLSREAAIVGVTREMWRDCQKAVQLPLVSLDSKDKKAG